MPKVLKPQEPAEGILLTQNFNNTKFYSVPCECGDPAHRHEVCIELDDLFCTVTTYTNQTTDFWSLGGLKTRLKLTWQLWIRGQITYQSSIIMNAQQALNYAETLKKAVKTLGEFKNEK